MIWYQRMDKTLVELRNFDEFQKEEATDGFICYGIDNCGRPTFIEEFSSEEEINRFFDWLLENIAKENAPKCFSGKEYLAYEDFAKFCSD